MADKAIKTRIKHKHETEDNWKKATNFTPLPGELIIYDRDENCSYPRLKIGDSTAANVNNLPFLNDRITDSELDDICK